MQRASFYSFLFLLFVSDRLFPPIRGKSGQGSSNDGNDPQEGGSSLNDGAAPTGSLGRASGSPNESTENIDPTGGAPKRKGVVKNRFKKKRQAPMNEI